MSRPTTEAQFCAGCGHKVFVAGGCEDPDGCCMELGVGTTLEHDKSATEGRPYQVGDYKKWIKNETRRTCVCGRVGFIEERFCGYCGLAATISRIRAKHGIGAPPL